jgi:hypothetical protein
MNFRKYKNRDMAPNKLSNSQTESKSKLWDLGRHHIYEYCLEKSGVTLSVTLESVSSSKTKRLTQQDECVWSEPYEC